MVKIMNRQNRKRGFTMAEMLIVVAIIGVLGAVTFIAVQQHQRSMERLERDAVAREIFVAAQNHLTMAQSQGYMGVANGKGETESATKGYYYFVVNQGDKFSKEVAPETLLDLMLPFGAIDETVRAGGSYIIRYHFESATVMDVFYCSNPSVDTRFGRNLNASEEKELVANWREGKESARKNYNGKVLGWYGGADAESLTRAELKDPEIDVENGSKLRVGINNNNGSVGTLQLIVKGVTSNAQKAIKLFSSESGFNVDSQDYKDRLDTNKTVNGKTYGYVVILDDITTAGLHFADMTADTGTFIPGEDIIVQAIAFDNTQISNIAYSAEITVNSLFEKLEVDTGLETMKASVSSIRHLENLDKRVSNVTDSRDIGEGASKVTYTLKNAVQTSDMSWTSFKEHTSGVNTAIQLYGEKAGSTNTGCYLPVVPTHALSYAGQYHSVSDVKVSYAGNAGLFGTITGSGDATNPTAIANLALIDFDIAQTGTGTVHAGALAGTLNSVDVDNVVAYNSKSTIATGIVAASGDAGGLIGYANACNVTKSAASVYVTATAGNAGGLIGETKDGKVSGCYSGGHTNKGTYYKDDGTEIYNVQAAAKNAGGLVGVASGTPIDHSYATCSVTGEIAGGFVASASATISDCYAVGMVKGTGTTGTGTAAVSKEGGFAYGSTTVTNCYYLEIMNERPDNEKYPYLPALGEKPTDTTSVKMIDESAEKYNTFCGAAKDEEGNDLWKPASPYDAKLIEYYGGRFNFKTVAQLPTASTVGVKETETTVGNVTAPADFVATHYGDWPVPEIFVVNTAD